GEQRQRLGRVASGGQLARDEGLAELRFPQCPESSSVLDRPVAAAAAIAHIEALATRRRSPGPDRQGRHQYAPRARWRSAPVNSHSAPSRAETRIFPQPPRGSGVRSTLTSPRRSSERAARISDTLAERVFASSRISVASSMRSSGRLASTSKARRRFWRLLRPRPIGTYPTVNVVLPGRSERNLVLR